MVDWTKPVKFFDGTPAEVLRVFEDENIVIITWVVPGGSRFVTQRRINEDLDLRNVPPKPREWWAVVCEDGSALGYKTAHEANLASVGGKSAVGGREVVLVGEILK